MQLRVCVGSIALAGSWMLGCGGDSTGDGGDRGSSSSADDDSVGSDGSEANGSVTLTAGTDDGPADSGESAPADESSSETTADGSTGDVPGCGNGVIDEGEACDDGNEADGDGCNSDCVESGAVQWELLYDGPAGLDDCARGIAINGDGVLALGGETADEEAYDGLTVSVSSDGRVLWDAVHDSVGEPESGGGSTDRIYGVAIDEGGNVFVAGHEYLDIETVWVSKLDLGGATVWTHTGAETSPGRGYGATVTDSGDVFVVGTHGLYAFVSHYDTDGVELWTEERKGSEGCNGCDAFWRVRATADGDPIVGGHLDNTSSDAFLGRFFANTGADDWSLVLDSAGMGHDSVSSLALTDTSALALFYWSDDVTATSELRSYTFDGDLEWVRADPLEGVLSFDFAVTSDGGVVVVGDAYAEATGITTIVTRFDVEGDARWTQELPSAAGGYQESRGIVVGPDGSIAIGGCKTDPVAAPSGDAWVIALAP